MPRIRFNWEINVGTVAMLLIQCFIGIGLGAAGWHRFKEVEKQTSANSREIAEVGRQVSRVDHKVDTLRSVFVERTGKPLP